jgi:hypothetical protein
MLAAIYQQFFEDQWSEVLPPPPPPPSSGSPAQGAGWFRHDWFESSYFAPVWFAPADESALLASSPQFTYGGRGGRPLLRYDASQDDMLRRVRDWYDWIEKRNAKTEPSVDAVEPEPAQEAQVVEPPPAPLRNVSLQYPARQQPRPQAPVAAPEPAAPQPAMASDPSDDFDYAALMAAVEKEVAFVDASMAEFQL